MNYQGVVVFGFRVVRNVCIDVTKVDIRGTSVSGRDICRRKRSGYSARRWIPHEHDPQYPGISRAPSLRLQVLDGNTIPLRLVLLQLRQCHSLFPTFLRRDLPCGIRPRLPSSPPRHPDELLAVRPCALLPSLNFHRRLTTALLHHPPRLRSLEGFTEDSGVESRVADSSYLTEISNCVTTLGVAYRHNVEQKRLDVVVQSLVVEKEFRQ